MMRRYDRKKGLSVTPIKYVLALVLVLSFNANAQVLKCSESNGKVLFSDRPIVCSGQSEVVRDKGSFVSRGDRLAAQERTVRMQAEIVDNRNERDSAALARHEAYRNDVAETERKAAAEQTSSNEANAVSNCVRDVERRGASQDVKAQLIAACRTSGLAQRSSGVSGDAVSNCVKNVERTGASEKVKSRELARCHGADVQPDHPHPVSSPVANIPSPGIIKNCSGSQCTDTNGNRYSSSLGKIVRSDGSRCYQQGNRIFCNER